MTNILMVLQSPDMRFLSLEILLVEHDNVFLIMYGGQFEV